MAASLSADVSQFNLDSAVNWREDGTERIIWSLVTYCQEIRDLDLHARIPVASLQRMNFSVERAAAAR
jgi:hypothetical protein